MPPPPSHCKGNVSGNTGFHPLPPPPVAMETYPLTYYLGSYDD